MKSIAYDCWKVQRLPFSKFSYEWKDDNMAAIYTHTEHIYVRYSWLCKYVKRENGVWRKRSLETM